MQRRHTPRRARTFTTRDALARTAERIGREIEQRHLPHGTIQDPIFAAPDSDQVVAYTRAGDSALWTGFYLAAEVYRFVVTRSPEALGNAERAIQAIKRLVDATGSNLLARVVFPADSPYADGVATQEAANGVHDTMLDGMLDGRAHFWVGNTSRDQYLGVFFGLSVAFEWLDDERFRAPIRDVVTRMLDFLLGNGWIVRIPDGDSSTTFLHRVDQRLALLQVGRQVNDDRFSRPYRNERFIGSATIRIPIAFEIIDDHSSYFKFNLVAISMFMLARQEGQGIHRSRYLGAYETFRNAVEDHGNAHFNMIARVLRGPDLSRDRETYGLLVAWMRRPRRDFGIDLRSTYEACGDRACRPIPVQDRVRSDFLWQRSPFQLVAGGDGFIENAGIDFVLPYWMARVYGVL